VKDVPATRVIVDTRPLSVVVLARSARLFAFAGIALMFWFMTSLPTPDGLTVQGQRALAIFVVALVLWVSQLLPLAITSLFALVALPLAGVMDKGQAYSLFGNEAVFFIMGAFILAAAMVKSGLSSRVALVFLRRFGGGVRQLVLGLLLVPAFLSFWMPEHAVAAMMFPITLEIVNGLKLRAGQSVFAKSAFIAAAYGAIIGGVATFLGGARNPLAIGILRETTGLSIGFFEWMVAVVPTVLVMLVIAYFLILRFFKSEITDVSKAAEALEGRIKSLGRLSLEEKMIGLIVGTAIFLWITAGTQLGLANIAIMAVVFLFIFKLVTWKDIEDYVNWGVILMYGGAIALGFAMSSTGSAAWVADSTILSWSLTPILLIILVAFLAVFLTEGISNVAVVALLLPLGITVAGSFGMDPRVMALVVAVPSGLAYMLPMGTPPNAIAFSSGFVGIRDMVKIGVILNFLSLAVFVIMARIYWPYLGLNF
jgi:solute carrier family 13 (sodium-dependent dicarboxylate transporter), member 2/3/5